MSFDEVYEQFQPLIYGVLKQFSIYESREDVLQEARLALWEAYVRFVPGKGSFPAYAKAYVRGRIKRYLTQQNKHRLEITMSAFNDEDETPQIEFEDSHAHLMFQQIESAHWLQPALAQLSVRERLVIESYYGRQIPLIDLAKKEQVSVETVKTWKKRALKKLRRTMSPDDHQS